MNSQRALTRCSLGAAMALALVPAALASGVTTWEMSSYVDFIHGRFEGVSLSRDGRLSIAPRVDPLLASDQAAVWALAQGLDGSIYAATGHRGRVYKIDRGGKSSVLWTAGQPEVFAIAVDRQGAVYAATSPDGAVYRIQNGVAAEYFAPRRRYILSLAVGADGALFVGTGDRGEIFRVTAAGQGEAYYETGQANVTSLAVDAQGRLLAGTEPNGILYRVTGKGKAVALYNSSLPEIRAIVPMADGTVYAAALGGAAAKRDQSSQSSQSGSSTSGLPTVYTSITVEAQEGGLKQPPDPAKPPLPQPVPAQASQTSDAKTSSASSDSGSGEKSAIYRINPDNSVETLWSSKEENAYDLAALDKQVLFATDGDGRIYGIAPDRSLSLVAQTKQGEATRLLAAERSVLAATSDMGRVFRLGEAPGQGGSYESPVHDVASVARWGNLSWRAEAAAGCTVAFRTRTGNSARPDQTWSEWSAPLTDLGGSRITSPTARYIQWKVEMGGPGGATPLLAGVTVAYLPQNSPPVVKNLSVVSQSAAAAQPKSAAAVTVGDTDTGAASGASGSTATQTLPKASNNQIVIAWQADDADGDRLVYRLYFRAEDETQWKLLKGDLHDSSATFDADLFADGRYYFRIVASDGEVNPPSSARETQLTSPPVLIDNTPPVVNLGAVRRNGATAHIEFEASDAASQLRRCEYSVDAAPWVPMEAADGLIDGLREKFALDLTGLAAGERLVVIRVADSAGNTGVAKVVLK